MTGVPLPVSTSVFRTARSSFFGCDKKPRSRWRTNGDNMSALSVRSVPMRSPPRAGGALSDLAGGCGRAVDHGHTALYVLRSLPPRDRSVAARDARTVV